MSLLAQIRAAPAEPCQPWPHHVLSAADWAAMATVLAAEPTVLLGLWADAQQVHVLLREGRDVLLASVTVQDGQYPALSPFQAAAAAPERMIFDLWGHVATGSAEARPWLDHGRWPLAHPMSPRPGLPGGAVEPPGFAITEAPGVMELPLGPIRDLIGEPAHLRLAVEGEHVRQAEARLGYAHKGTLALMRGKSPRNAARFVARLAAEATVAHSLAFARAAEAALQTAAPARAVALRAIMAEFERIATHLDDLAQLADLAGLPRLHATAGRHGEVLRRAAEQAFGHRLMMDLVVPGGVAVDIAPDGPEALRRALADLAAGLAALERQAAPLLGRLDGVGTIRAPAVGGIVGRAAGGQFDARLLDPAFILLELDPPFEHAGDGAARCRLRLAEIADSLRLLRSLLGEIPDGPTAIALPPESGEGLGCAEATRGALWHWMRLDHGQIAAGFPCDSGWLLWPLAEATVAAGTVEDIDMIRLSCGLPVAALDL
jgi:Ni,Fe-hydrogenase III large subunit